jgi:hypothetical protein
MAAQCADELRCNGGHLVRSVFGHVAQPLEGDEIEFRVVAHGISDRAPIPSPAEDDGVVMSSLHPLFEVVGIDDGGAGA